LTDFQEAQSIVYQVTLSLAIAESALQFEHRDLHWGNVLVQRTSEPTLSYMFDGSPVSVDTHGVKVTIIDFTMSRLSKGVCDCYIIVSNMSMLDRKCLG